MSEIDRSQVIELLERLGAEDDAAVLAAARELHGLVSEAGLTWDDLLEPEDEDEEFAEEDEDDATEDEDDPAAEEDSSDGEEPLIPGDLEEDARIIDRLLSKKRISADTRAELSSLKEDMAAGEFTAMDSRYVRALAKRLEA